MMKNIAVECDSGYNEINGRALYEMMDNFSVVTRYTLYHHIAQPYYTT